MQQKFGIGTGVSDLNPSFGERGSKVTQVVEIVNKDGEIIQFPSGLVPENFDYIALSYDSSGNLTGVLYKTGGATGSTVATLALSYNQSDVLQNVTKT